MFCGGGWHTPPQKGSGTFSDLFVGGSANPPSQNPPPPQKNNLGGVRFPVKQVEDSVLGLGASLSRSVRRHPRTDLDPKQFGDVPNPISTPNGSATCPLEPIWTSEPQNDSETSPNRSGTAKIRRKMVRRRPQPDVDPKTVQRPAHQNGSATSPTRIRCGPQNGSATSPT